MLFSAAMSVASEAPASFRSSPIRPGSLALIQTGFLELLSRRRLIRYLVQADLKKKGADTLLGNVWWVVDPLLQMLVYVILVSVIFDRGPPDYPLFIFCAILPWKWFTTVDQRRRSRRSRDGAADQADQLPEARPAGRRRSIAGIVELLVRVDPARRPDRPVLRRPRSATVALLIPVVAFVQLLFTLPVAIVLGAINVFYRDIGNLSRHVLRLGFYVSPGLYAVGRSIDTGRPRSTQLVGPLILANPWTILFTSYRDVIYDGLPPDWSASARLSPSRSSCSPCAILIFKRLEPTFAKVL